MNVNTLLLAVSLCFRIYMYMYDNLESFDNFRDKYHLEYTPTNHRTDATDTEWSTEIECMTILSIFEGRTDSASLNVRVISVY